MKVTTRPSQIQQPNFGFPSKLGQEAEDYFQHALFYLKNQKNTNDIFWSRLAEKPSFHGAKVLELGCGLGSLSLDIASAGAAEVIGLDLNERDVEFAQMNLQQNYPQLQNKVKFLAVNLQDYSEKDFDFIVSKDTFEHVLDLEIVLSEIKKRLKIGGKLYTGFGPLWHSPFGFHGNLYGWNFTNKYPWGHLLLSEAQIVSSWNNSTNQKINSFADLGMNKLSTAQYHHIFANCGLEIEKFQVNKSNSLQSKIFALLYSLPFIGKYFCHNIYCIFRKDQ
ncbi:MAG: class I SAM-dependent methyltransferase [Symploca sp. SIO2D2]|nr:class I SAM-dependent methyltransferase [Symploca sp. SIO2D2]